jgi:hypothetical protein
MNNPLLDHCLAAGVGMQQHADVREPTRLWPQAKVHSQWPGTGRIGNPVFDAFYPTQVPYLADNAQTQRLNQEGVSSLLDRIGPAIILTHSQSSPFGWLADRRRRAVEPTRPPFQNAVLGTDKARAWGVTDIPITYDPPVNDPTELKIEQQAQPDGPDLVRCWQQQAPARRLANLADIPAVVITTEASYHAAYDHCSVKYLAQAGVKVTALRLGDHGIHGNGHMVMLEKNNQQVAALSSTGLPTPSRTDPRPQTTRPSECRQPHLDYMRQSDRQGVSGVNGPVPARQALTANPADRCNNVHPVSGSRRSSTYRPGPSAIAESQPHETGIAAFDTFDRDAEPNNGAD